MPEQLNKWIVDNFKQPLVVATMLFRLSQRLLVFLIWKNILWCKEIPTPKDIELFSKPQLFFRFYTIHITSMAKAVTNTASAKHIQLKDEVLLVTVSC